MKRILLSVLIILGAVGSSTPLFAETQSEHVDWGRWSFDWEIRDNTGLALRHVKYADELILNKASMPVIRVKYVKERVWWNPFTWFGTRADSGRCGPFQDRLRWQDLVPIVNCGNQKVCMESATQNNVKWLEVGVYARIGEYHIYQSWHLSEDGELRPVVQSRGLSCNTNHDHHPYWRFDFDINGSGMDQVFVHEEGAADRGWGPGWRKYVNERNDVKTPALHTTWLVRDQVNGHGVWVQPGAGYAPLKDDGNRDKFADFDVAIRRANVSEDLPWSFGARGQLAYDEDNQGVQEQDVVLWYIAHLPHMAALGPTKWLALGPILRVQQ